MSSSTYVLLSDLLESTPEGMVELDDGVTIRRFRVGDGHAWADVEFDQQIKGPWGVPKRERSRWVEIVESGLLADSYKSDGAVCRAGEIIGRITVTTCEVNYERIERQHSVTEVQIFLKSQGCGLGTKIIEKIRLLADAHPEKVVYHLAARIHPEHRRPTSLLVRLGFERAPVVDSSYEWWLWPKYDLMS